MFFEIPLKTNLYNFSQTVSLATSEYNLRFQYQGRKQTYVLDIMDSGGGLLEAGLPCVVNVQLNRRIVKKLPGVLFFQSSDPRLSYADTTSLGTKVRLIYYDPFS